MRKRSVNQARNLNIWKNPADRQRVVDELREKGFCENIEGRFQRKDGSQTFGMLSAKIITLKGVPHVVSFTRDINDRKKAEEALRASEARYRAVSHSATDAIVTADGAGNIVSWNRGAEKMFGYTVFEVSGQPVTRLMPDRYTERHLSGMSRLRAGEDPQDRSARRLNWKGDAKMGASFLSNFPWPSGRPPMADFSPPFSVMLPSANTTRITWNMLPSMTRLPVF